MGIRESILLMMGSDNPVAMSQSGSYDQFGMNSTVAFVVQVLPERVCTRKVMGCGSVVNAAWETVGRSWMKASAHTSLIRARMLVSPGLRKAFPEYMTAEVSALTIRYWTESAVPRFA